MVFLIAEDNPLMRASIKNFLLTRIPGQHTVYEASDGAEAIELYERIHPDWVFMDIVMEPVDGLVASRRLRSAHPEAKIIILTNYADKQYRRAADELGVRGFLLKEHLDQIPKVLLQD